MHMPLRARCLPIDIHASLSVSITPIWLWSWWVGESNIMPFLEAPSLTSDHKFKNFVYTKQKRFQCQVDLFSAWPCGALHYFSLMNLRRVCSCLTMCCFCNCLLRFDGCDAWSLWQSGCCSEPRATPRAARLACLALGEWCKHPRQNRDDEHMTRSQDILHDWQAA